MGVLYTGSKKEKLFKQLQAQNPVSMKCAVPNWQVKTDERMIQIRADLMPYGHATHEGLGSLKQNDSRFLFLGQTIIPLLILPQKVLKKKRTKKKTNEWRIRLKEYTIDYYTMICLQKTPTCKLGAAVGFER